MHMAVRGSITESFRFSTTAPTGAAFVCRRTLPSFMLKLCLTHRPHVTAPKLLKRFPLILDQKEVSDGREMLVRAPLCKKGEILERTALFNRLLNFLNNLKYS